MTKRIKQTDPEVWRTIPSIPGYIASSHGRVMKTPYLADMPHGGLRNYGGEPTFGAFDKVTGRLNFQVKGKNVKVSRAVCEAFHGPAPSPNHVCMHIDENSRNNRPENLAWGTQEENMSAPGFTAYTQNRTKADLNKLTKEQAFRAKYSTQRPAELAREFGVAPCTVSNIRAGRSWRRI